MYPMYPVGISFHLENYSNRARNRALFFILICKALSLKYRFGSAKMAIVKGELNMKLIYKQAFAEFLGTFVLVLFGTGVAVITSVFTSQHVLYTALAFGLSVVAMAYTVGHVSGGHFNPAVSFAFFLKKQLDAKGLLVFVASQLVGALLASLLLVVMFDSNAALGANLVSTTLPGSGFVELLYGVLVEALLTFIFITVILQVTRPEKASATTGLVIGLTLVVVILFGFYLTGVGVNPARSLAPALFQGGVALEQVWVFIAGPLLGAYLAFLGSKLLD